MKLTKRIKFIPEDQGAVLELTAEEVEVLKRISALDISIPDLYPAEYREEVRGFLIDVHREIFKGRT